MKRNNPLTFSERLKKCRIQRKETQEELAKALNLSRVSIFDMRMDLCLT